MFDPTVIPLVYLILVVSLAAAITATRCVHYAPHSDQCERAWFDFYRAIIMSAGGSALLAYAFIDRPDQYMVSLSRATATLWLLWAAGTWAFCGMRLNSLRDTRHETLSMGRG